MCPECRRSLAEGHAPGCRNGPQIALINVPIGRPPEPARCRHRRVRSVYDANGSPQYAMCDDCGQRVGEAPADTVSTMTLAEAQSIMTRAAEIGLTQAQIEALAQHSLELAERLANPPLIVPTPERYRESDVRPGVRIRTGLPYVQFSRVGDPSRWDVEAEQAPRTSAEMPARRVPSQHLIAEILQGDPRFQGGLRIECGCGWQVYQDYLVGMNGRDIRGMVDAHCAGGQVGPTQKIPKPAYHLDAPKITSGRHELINRMDGHYCSCGEFEVSGLAASTTKAYEVYSSWMAHANRVPWTPATIHEAIKCANCKSYRWDELRVYGVVPSYSVCCNGIMVLQPRRRLILED